MAKTHGLPGRYSKSRVRGHLHILFYVFCWALFAYGFGSGYVFANGTRPWVWLGPLIGVGLLLAVVALLGRWVNKIEREHIFLQRGMRGEVLVGWLLNGLPENWHVFHSIQLQEYQDLDHIVVGPGGLFYVSTKNYLGMFTQDLDGSVLYNGKPTDLLRRTVAQGMEFRDRLQAVLGRDSSALYVNMVLAVPFAWIDLKGEPQHVRVLNQNDLVKWIEGAPNRLSPQRINMYVKALERLVSVSQPSEHGVPQIAGTVIAPSQTGPDA